MSNDEDNKKFYKKDDFIKKTKNKKNLNLSIEEEYVYRFRYIRDLAKKKKIDLSATLEKEIIKFINKAEIKFNVSSVDWKNIKKCPKCGSELVIRKHNEKQFYGCSSYPKCNFTSSIDD